MNAPLPNGWPDMARDWAGPEAMMRRVDFAWGVAGRGAGLEPMVVAEQALGPLLGEATRGEMMRAGSRREALALLEHEQLIAPKGRDLFVKQISRDEFI